MLEPYFGHATQYGKFSYPPGFPLLNAPLFLIKGADQDVVLKLHSALLFTSLCAFISYLFIKKWQWYALLPLVLSLFFFLGDAAWTVSYWLYSEPLLLMCCAVSTFLFLHNATCSSILAAGAASMIKQEGLLFMLLIILASLMISREKRDLLKLAGLTMLPIISWKLIVKWQGIQDSDFDFTLSQFNREYLKQTFEAVYACATDKWASYSGMITTLPLLIIYSVVVRELRILWMLLVALAIIGCYLMVMPFSSVSDIEWHLTATTRYMMLPVVIVMISLGEVMKEREKEV